MSPLVIDNFKVRKGLKGMKSFPAMPDNFVQSFRVDHRQIPVIARALSNR